MGQTTGIFYANFFTEISSLLIFNALFRTSTSRDLHRNHASCTVVLINALVNSIPFRSMNTVVQPGQHGIRDVAVQCIISDSIQVLFLSDQQIKGMML